MIRSIAAFFLIVSTASAAWSANPPAIPSSPTAPHAKPGPKSDHGHPVAKPFVYAPKDSDLVTGKPDAPVTVVEYASLSCPHCSHFFLHALPVITAKYIDTGKVKLVYRNFPLNAPALKAAELVQCADPEKRHAYVKVLFSTQMKWAVDANFHDALSNIAVMGGMDPLKFEACMNDKTVERAVLAVAKQAQDDYQVSSTPTFFIDGIEYKGDHDAAAMGKVIDVELAKPAKK